MKMKHALMALMAACTVSLTTVSGAEATKPGLLNVKDFGAKGDGVTDDTDAIQRCLLKAAGPGYPKFFYRAFVAAPEVFFPKGTYLVSRPLLVPECGGAGGKGLLSLRGDDATIKQVDPTQDILYFRLAYRILVEGLTFDGGKRQIKLWSKNIDTAHAIIRDCVFRNSAGAALDDQLRSDMTKKNDWASNIIEPYEVSVNGQGLPKLTPVDESKFTICGFVSTCMRVNRCSFQRCMQAMSVWADWTLMDNCEIETNPDMSGPAILSGGTLLLENVKGLAHASPGKEQWWISMDPGKQPYGNVSVYLKNVQLKTDAEEGWCVIRNEAAFTGGNHSCIVADGCEFQAAGSKENCLLYLVEAPNLINVRNCQESSGRDVNIVGFERPMAEDYFHFHSPEVFSYMLDENNTHLLPDMPDPMMRFADKALPEKIAQSFDQQPVPLTLPEMRKGLAKQLNLMAFGAKGDGTADESGAFQKAFAAAAREDALSEVVVPNGLYRMDRTVELPPRVVVRGSGHVALTVPPGKRGSIFNIPGAEHVLLQNLHFFKCTQAAAITTRTDDKCEIMIDNCFFNENSDFAVTCLSGTGGVAEPNKTTLSMSDCTFVYSRALEHNANYALVENCWITTDPDMVNSGAIVNKGTFHLKSLCGVPQTSRTCKTSGKDRADTKANDMRWVDNYHRLLIDRCRFGGEDGGLPMAVNFAAKGQVLLQDSWIGIHAGKRLTIVDCEELPDLIALRGNWGCPMPAMMLTVRNAAKGSLDGRFFESGNTAPAWIKDERKNNH